MARLYIGTYTRPEDHVDGHGEGIYCFELDESTFALSLRSVTRDIVNPSYLALNTAGSRLYAASETTQEPGRLYAYAVAADSGRLRLLNHQGTRGAAPCYVSVTGSHVMVANYLGGSAAVLPIDQNGGVAPLTDLQVHHGSSINQVRQQSAHPHAIVPDPARTYALVPDLGTDTVTTYQFDAVQGRLTVHGTPLRVRPGAGPRHLTFDASGRVAYIVNELDSTILVCSYEKGTLATRQTVAALPRSFSGTPSGADIHLHPTGRFLYVSLRDISCIVRMHVDPDTGLLRGRAYAHVLGTTPRNFAVDPKGHYLIVANQDSNSLVVMTIDHSTGLLTPAGPRTNVPSPACIAIVT